ncbi:proton-coupled amino acid transporter-like protein CG1139 isoform X2 [Sipha flava]|nr:proton-coupled amino acid transporter-like protein CG1139 isoform X2 [Sipha flava]XP_025408113.1 proton-coupled amino acid transporter-like protein CG1139 isoform X2 [Sipha flava]XP_025408114.1 proton-coupled amino acid transporter-like protein CG1139 isoform X2 [Sipha flava]XP_025408115.1 proton-coupled amino acid transporter-like protein CG1139 isoform X2 [Sipha flava]
MVEMTDNMTRNYNNYTSTSKLEQASKQQTLAMDGYDNQGMLRSELNINGNATNVGNTCINMDSLNSKCGVVGTKSDNAGQLNEKQHFYDPYQHREVKHPTSYFDTLIHFLKASLGTGILAMPSAFKNAGYIVGTLGTIAIGILCTYTIHLLVTASYELCVKRKIPSLTYPGTVAAAFEDGPRPVRKFAPFAKMMTNLFLVLYQIGSSCIYVVFIASNLKAIGDTYLNNDTDVRMYMVYILIPLILISWIRNLKLLAPFSSIATCMTMVSFTLIFYYIFREAPSFESREPVGTIKSIPLFFGTVLFAMEAIGMVLPLENEMKNPKRFGSMFGVLNSSMIPISLLYTLVGILGYLKYGEHVKGSITLDLPHDEVLAQVVKLLLSLSIYICYALSNYVAFDILWKGFEHKMEKNEHKICWEYALRTSIVITTFFFAIAIPNLEHLISLIGAFCLSSVGIAFPAIVSFLTFNEVYKNAGNFRYSLFCLRNLVIVIIAIFAFIIGVFTSVSDIIHHMK